MTKEELHAIRNILGKDQQAFGEALGFTAKSAAQMVCRMEKGKANISKKTTKIAEYLLDSIKMAANL